MLGGDSAKRQEATKALALIDDPRVIPWYLKAMDTDSSDLKRAALDRLAEFPGDAALEGIKKGMKTQRPDSGDFTDLLANGGWVQVRGTARASGATATPDLLAQAAEADGVRLAAARALTRSPHPQTQKLLLSMWDDPSPAVRMTVLRVVEKLPPAEALPLLQEMSQTLNHDVGFEAGLYLMLRMQESLSEAFDRWLKGENRGAWPTYKPGEISPSTLKVVVSPPNAQKGKVPPDPEKKLPGLRMSSAELATIRAYGTLAKQDRDVLVLSLKVENNSSVPIRTTLAHEWYGGEWPSTNLYVSVFGPDEKVRADFKPVFLAGETGKEEKLAIEPGKSVATFAAVGLAGNGFAARRQGRRSQGRVHADAAVGVRGRREEAVRHERSDLVLLSAPPACGPEPGERQADRPSGQRQGPGSCQGDGQVARFGLAG